MYYQKVKAYFAHNMMRMYSALQHVKLEHIGLMLDTCIIKILL